MSNWLLWSVEHLLQPVYDRLHEELLKREVLHADETTLQIPHEPGKTAQSSSYMWLCRTGGDTGWPIVLFDYQPERGAFHPKTFLADFKGYLHTDGCAGYHSLPNEVTVVGCWAHARRKLDEAIKSLSKGKAKNSSAAQGLAYCDLLFKIEDWRVFPKKNAMTSGWSRQNLFGRSFSVGKYQSRRAEIYFGQGPVLFQGPLALFI